MEAILPLFACFGSYFVVFSLGLWLGAKQVWKKRIVLVDREERLHEETDTMATDDFKPVDLSSKPVTVTEQ